MPNLSQHVNALFLGAPRLSKRLRGPRVFTALSALAAGVGLFTPKTARAQNAINNEFSVQRFDPAPGPRNYFTTRGARVDGHLAWSAGLFLNYAWKPFVIRSCEAIGNCDDPNANLEDTNVVENLATADVLGSISLFDRVQVGLKVPVTFADGVGFSDVIPDSNEISSVGLGDITLEGKVRAYGEVTDPFVVGGTVFVTGPLGTATAEGTYIGDPTVTGGLKGIFDGRQGPFSFGGNLGFALRGEGRVGSTKLGHEFRYGIGAGYEASPVIRIVLDSIGATKFSSRNGTNALEIDGGVQVTPLGSPITISAGLGTGVIEGVGVPLLRVFAGALYNFEMKDSDGDGIMDGDDQCPTIAEDMDGDQDTDGCPEGDSDGDTIADEQDKCPKEAEDFDQFEDTDGCPEVDNDKDGINDDQDHCPDKPETKNGFKDEDGCPDEPDADGDGVPDARDKCKDQPEDTDGFQDTDGCPDPDNDGDGINDDQDECVDEPETKNGIQDEDGCPEQETAAPAPGGATPAPAPGAAPAPAPAPAPKKK